MFDDDDRDDRVNDWAGGGGWQDNNDPPPPDPPPPPAPPPPPKKKPKAQLGPYRPTCKRGLVAGRFLPLHLGHEHLLGTAIRSSEELDVVVFAANTDPITGDTRARWLRELFPLASVHVTARGADFAQAIRTATGRTDHDVFYGGEIAEGIAAAKSIGATFVPIDPDREAFPISGTEIREDVMKHYGDIAAVARPWFVRRVAVIGPPSTGKTELCKRLAQIYSTRFVPEPARALAQARGGDIDPTALELWFRTQLASEATISRHANRLLFADTDPNTVVLWSRGLFDQVPDMLQALAMRMPYDLVILCNDDVPFVGPPGRDDPAARRDLFEALRHVSATDRRVVLTGTSWEARLLTARKAVDQLLGEKTLLSKRGATMS